MSRPKPRRRDASAPDRGHDRRIDGARDCGPSMVNCILISRVHGGLQLAKQTEWGEEYVAFSYCPDEAWRRLSRITGYSVAELKRLPTARM